MQLGPQQHLRALQECARSEVCLCCLRHSFGLQVSGLSTNVAFLKRLCQHPAFEAAELDTSFIAKHMDDLVTPPQPGADVLALAAVTWHLITLRVRCIILIACISSSVNDFLLLLKGSAPM